MFEWFVFDSFGIVRAYTCPQSLFNSEIAEITNKIVALDEIRATLERDLLKLQEDDLELDDECVLLTITLCLFRCLFISDTVEGVKERLEFEKSMSQLPKAKAVAQGSHIHQSSRRRKGPAFLPSEHNDLPPGIAFMVRRPFSFAKHN